MEPACPKGARPVQAFLELVSLSVERTEEVLGKRIAENEDFTQISIRNSAR